MQVGRDSDYYQRRRRRFSAVVLLLLLATSYIFTQEFIAWQVREVQEYTQDTRPQPDTPLARVALDELPIKERITQPPYSRSYFGSGWAQVAGCDMRNRILQRDLIQVVLDADNCTVLSGILEDDPLSGTTVHFERDSTSTSPIHIEHLVAVSDAWHKGAHLLTEEQRRSFYNDPLNLVAASAKANLAKGNADASEWLPPRTHRCQYVARQIAVKVKHLIWITQQEYQAMRRVLSRCPDQRLPLEAAAHAS